MTARWLAFLSIATATLEFFPNGSTWNRAFEECRQRTARLADAAAVRTFTDDMAWTSGFLLDGSWEEAAPTCAGEGECLAASANCTYGEGCDVLLPFACERDLATPLSSVVSGARCDGEHLGDQECFSDVESCADFCLDGYDLPLAAYAENSDQCCCANACCPVESAGWTMAVLPSRTPDCGPIVLDDTPPEDDDDGGPSPSFVVFSVVFIVAMFLIAIIMAYRQYQQRPVQGSSDVDPSLANVTVTPDSILDIPMAKRIYSIQSETVSSLDEELKDTSRAGTRRRIPSIDSNSEDRPAESYPVDQTPRSVPRALLPRADPTSPVVGFTMPQL